MQEFLDLDNHEEKVEHDGEGRWPFHSFVEELILDMFDPGWLLLFLFLAGLRLPSRCSL